MIHFEKNFYRESSSVADRSKDEIDDYRKKHQMTLNGRNIPKPVFTFEETSLPSYLLTQLLNLKFKEPTPIQAQGWPMALSGRNVVGIAKTGSGKTLAFSLPAVLHINAQPLLAPGDGPICLILAPTRELAIQIHQEITKYCASSKIKAGVVYGGASKGPQARELERGVDILVATPGRLMDFLQCKTTNLRRVTYFVLDEADRMLDMGFVPQIRQIFRQVYFSY